MGFPKFNSETFRNAMLGVGALALVSLPGGSVAQDASRDTSTAPIAATTAASNLSGLFSGDSDAERTPAVFELAADSRESATTRPAPASFAQDTTYAELGIPEPTEPTEGRPFYTYSFDERMLSEHPDVSPLHLQAFEYDKILVYNFVDNSPEGQRFSQMQTQVLERTLAALAPRSEAKDIMLVNVVTADAENEPVYGAAFLALYKDENRLGPDGQPRENVILPYGIVYGEPLAEGNSHRLMDFALLNGVRTDADLNANANAISGSLYDIVHTYNQKKLAALDTSRPTLAGLQ